MPSGLINDAEIKSSAHSSNNVGATFDFVAKNGNNVESTFDTVERIVKHVAFDTVALTLLLVWTGLKIK